MKKPEYPCVFLMGAAAYYGLECLWRGYSHWTMALAGGTCLSVIYYLSKKRRSHPARVCLEGALLITGVEFLTGCIVNRWLGWNVWDYSAMPGNLFGQICPLYCTLWVLLCIPVFFVCLALQRLFQSQKTI